MTELTKETITTQRNDVSPSANTQVKREATSSQTVEYLIYFFFGALEILLAFRLVLKLTGASATSAFVNLVYSLTGIFILPFEGIFRRGFAQGVETTSVLEPSTLVELLYMLLWLGELSSYYGYSPVKSNKQLSVFNMFGLKIRNKDRR